MDKMHTVRLLILLAVFIGLAGATGSAIGLTFEQFANRHDTDHDGSIGREEFRGAPAFFRHLDNNRDGQVTRAEFDAFRRERRAPLGKSRPDGRRDRPGNGGLSIPSGVTSHPDLEYAQVDGQSLTLDLYLPDKAGRAPLVVWIHGGGWSRGDKTQVNPMIIRLAQEGYAIASINYRLGGLNLHPAQIHDVKGAVRWLRANADRYRYDASRIAVGGGSAGAHLALLLALSGGVPALEGGVGGNLDQSSRVQAVVDMFGPSALEDLAKQDQKFGRNKAPDLLRAASPLAYLTKDDPPVLIFHGDLDPVVPLSQSRELDRRYKEIGLDSELYVVKGAGHGGSAFSDSTRYALIKDFLDHHIRVGTSQDVAIFDSNSRSPLDPEPLGPSVSAEGEATTRLTGFHWLIGPRTGLAGSQREFEQLLNRINANLSDNPNITGVYVITHWNLIEPREGQFNFSRLERVLVEVRRHDRYYKLAVVPGIYSPDWLYQKGAEAFDSVGANPSRKEYYERPVRLPVPWDSIYQDYYFRALQEVAKRFGSDPQFRAMTLTVASFMSPEWHLPRSPEDRRKWQSMSGFPGVLQSTWERGIDRFAQLFPDQILVLEASSYPVEQKELGDAVVDYAVNMLPGRFAIQINQLTGRFDMSNRPTYIKLLDYRRRYGKRIVIGLQDLKGWGFPKISEEQGSKEMTAYNFLQADGEYWELWFHDGGKRETCDELAALWGQGREEGLVAFREHLVREGSYRPTVSPRHEF